MATETVQEMIGTAAELRARATRLHEIASGLNRAADALEVEITGGTKQVLRGRDLMDEVVKLVPAGKELHYRDIERLLLAAGFTAGGVDPSATLLAQINRAPEFERTRRRSGVYRRVPALPSTEDCA